MQAATQWKEKELEEIVEYFSSPKRERQRMTREQAIHLIGRRGIESVIMQAFKEVPREFFVPEELRQFAYMDSALPIGYDQTISQPQFVLKMLEWLEVSPSQTILEIGAGSGYNAALLGKLAGRVISTEIISELEELAKTRMKEMNYNNVQIMQAEKNNIGWRKEAPYDRIIVTAVAPEIPPELVDQLAIGGYMIVPASMIPLRRKPENMDRLPPQILWKIERKKEGCIRQMLTECTFVPLQYGAFLTE